MNTKALVVTLGLLILVLASSFGQNLITNPSFEHHRDNSEITSQFRGHAFDKLLYREWTSLGWPSNLCHCKYVKHGREKYYRTCQIEEIRAHSGCALVQMNFHNRGKDWDLSTYGGASYLSQKLKNSLQIGSVYKVSFWVYIPSYEGCDPNMGEHIGIGLSNKKKIYKNIRMFHRTGLSVDRVEYDNWYNVSWVIRPLCEMNYLTIGVFKSAIWPVYDENKEPNLYFIDDVAIVKVDELTGKNIDPIGIPFCNFIDDAEKGVVPLVDVQRFFFDSGKADLSIENKVKLDSFIDFARINSSLVFKINGHTDDQGNDNFALSLSRCEVIKNYIIDKGLPSPRFICQGFGEEQSMNSNEKEIDRAKNRRVEIIQTSISIQQALYRAALVQYEKNNVSKALGYFTAWSLQSDRNNKILASFDPRLKDLKEHQHWKVIERNIKREYGEYEQPLYAYTLDSLLVVDQKYRSLELELRGLTGKLNAQDTFPILLQGVSDGELKKNDLANFQRLEALIEKFGFPIKSEVGSRPASAAFYILDHQTDSNIFINYLPMIYNRCVEGEADWLSYATMYDRLQMYRGLPQRYGTQWNLVKGDSTQSEIYQLENAGLINFHRVRIGLPKLTERDFNKKLQFKN